MIPAYQPVIAAPVENLYTPGKIRTYTGRYIDVFSPKPEDIDIEDIAHALSMNGRWAGHAKVDFKIAQHCVTGAQILMNNGLYEDAFQFLMHEGEESYLHDLPKPIKDRMPEYDSRGTLLRQFIYLQYQLPIDDSPAVKEVDKYLLEFEWENIVLTYRRVKLTAWSQEYAKEQFLKMFYYLQARVNK